MEDVLAAQRYKMRQEQWVSDNAGSDMYTLAALGAVLPLLVFLRSTIQSRAVVVDVAVLVFPVLLTYTVLAEFIGALVLVLLGVCVMRRGRSYAAPCVSAHYIPCIADLRFTVLVGTCVAILAVDFPAIWPKMHTKTEMFGVALMDVGAGGFVFIAGLTSRRVTSAASLWPKVRTKVLPLLVLGVLRLLTIKSTDYQEHVSEYGVHWNFFFTLAAVTLVSPVLLPRITPLATVKPLSSRSDAAALGVTSSSSSSSSAVARLAAEHLVRALVMVVLHQWLLSDYVGGTHYIESHPRNNVVHANKEGLVSIPGYLALFLCGACVRSVLGVVRAAELKSVRVAIMGVTAACLWSVAVCSESYIQPCSRRMVNASYIAWLSAQLTSVLFSFECGHMFAAQTPMNTGDVVSIKQDHLRGTCVLIRAINRHSLATFLIANLLTGAVNVCTSTLDAGAPQALASMTAYLVLLCGVVVGLFSRSHGRARPVKSTDGAAAKAFVALLERQQQQQQHTDKTD
jgi:phosphatidylinositol glycan class W